MTLLDGKYKYVKYLGAGGFGKVVLAEELVSKRLVAIKQLKNLDKKEQEDIIHEIETVSKFNSPNIVTYYHHYWHDEKLHLVMEYCQGGTLADKMSSSDIPDTDVFNWMLSLSACLGIVHKKGVVHHDIKPSNILFAENGTIKISDFGIANTEGGTRAYMSPEALAWDESTRTDQRVDVYALGVTLMELLANKNPFFLKSKEEIIEIHQKADFPIKNLPNWQQEIILRAINKLPELRFQHMAEMEEAIKAKAVPVIFKKEVLKAAELVDYAERALRTKKWRSALKYLELAATKYPNNVSLLQAYGKYYLLMNKIEFAKVSFEKALALNPRLDLQKDLGWINLENKNYPIAISLLSDHLHRHPSDYEAYNLLLRCYYETGRYEPAMELAKMLMESNDRLLCFANNYYISCAMQNLGHVALPNTMLKAPDNPFIDYNLSVVLEDKETHALDKSPTLKSKLLFMDYRFNNLTTNTFTFLESDNQKATLGSFDKTIVKIGREGYDANDLQVPGGTAISRRHCLIVNCKDDVWLYDLESTGTYLNDERIRGKTPLMGTNKLGISNVDYTVTTDKNKLL